MNLLSVLSQGQAMGRADGQTVGRADGPTVGRADGPTVGRADGQTVGKADGQVATKASEARVPLVLEPEPPRAPGDTRLRVMLCGTYPIGQSNGYSRVVYYIAKHLGAKSDIQLTIYGFQNYQQTRGADARNDIPSDVIMYDCLANEKPARNGFGEKEFGEYLRQRPQDIVIIYNDMVVTSALVQTMVRDLTPEERKRFKLVSYMDQVYPYQKKVYINMLNEHFDAVVAFTEYWRETARWLGVTLPIYVFPHGFDPERYFPIPRELARMYFHVPSNAFVVLNLNRNQPRKRWDYTIIAMAEVVARHLALKKSAPAKAERPIILMVGTQIDGFWNLPEIFEFELKKRGIGWDVGKTYITSVAKPQQLSDAEVNIMYNAADIGINTAAGEGVGLGGLEHTALGCPQVVGNIGGHKEFLSSQYSIMLEPKLGFYMDKSTDAIGGYAELCDPMEFADGIWKYYTSKSLYERHSKRGRREILTHFKWSTVCDYFHRELLDIAGSA